MAKKVDSSVLDAALDKVATATTLVFCSGVNEPANYAGIAAVALVTKTGLTTGSFTKSSSGNNRLVTVAAQTNMTPSAGGTVTWAVLHDGSTLLAATSVTSQLVATNQTWNSPAFAYQINQPT